MDMTGTEGMQPETIAAIKNYVEVQCYNDNELAEFLDEAQSELDDLEAYVEALVSEASRRNLIK